jgi:hypothetical protein
MVKNGRNRNVWPRPGSTSFALLVAAVRTRPIGKSTRISSNSKIARLPQPRAGHYRECGHHANHSLDSWWAGLSPRTMLAGLCATRISARAAGEQRATAGLELARRRLNKVQAARPATAGANLTEFAETDQHPGLV